MKSRPSLEVVKGVMSLTKVLVDHSLVYLAVEVEVVVKMVKRLVVDRWTTLVVVITVKSLVDAYTVVYINTLPHALR